MRILVSENNIQRRVGELAALINRDYAGRRLLVLGILKGSLIFLADLVRRIRVPLRYEVVVISSYRDGTEPGAVDFYGELPQAEPDEAILVVEDIIDTGQTMSKLRRWLDAHYNRSVGLCVMLDKQGRRNNVVELDYVGFTLETNDFLVGYGLDYAGGMRNLPFIAALEEGETE